MKNSYLLIMSVLLLASCRKVPDFDQLSSDFIVSTSLDQKANFGGYKTYFMSDTIKYVGGVGSDSIIIGDKAKPLIDAVKSNMASRGYTFVTSRNNNPDLGITLTAIKDINVVYSYFPGWWDPWYGGCYWYYWCYGYWYPWSTAYVYTTGTVFLNMYDLKNAHANRQLRGIWNITGLGALGSGSTTNTQLAIDAINQGFIQSPYIKTP